MSAIIPFNDDIKAISWVLAGLESKHTERAYEHHLLNFLDWFKGQGSPTLSKAVVSAYKAHLQAMGKGASVINQALSAIRKMVNEAADNGKLDPETAQAITRIKSVKAVTLPAGRSISSGELFALLDQCDSPRDAAIIALLYSTGMRRGELIALNLEDYDPSTSELKILHGKGNKQRLVPVQNGAVNALADWLKIRGNWAGPLFCPVYRSGHVKQARMTTQAIYHIVEKRAEQAGIEKSLSPHDFRRTVIGDLLDRGADISTVQQLVGHANVTTTARYDRRGNEAKRKAVNLLHVPYKSKNVV